MIKIKRFTILIIIIMFFSLFACSQRENSESDISVNSNAMINEDEQIEKAKDNSNTKMTEYINKIPSKYFNKAKNNGKIEKITYKSKDYTSSSNKTINKTAYVYLPYGYGKNSDMRYNVLYLMHGWTMTAG